MERLERVYLPRTRRPPIIRRYEAPLAQFGTSWQTFFCSLLISRASLDQGHITALRFRSPARTASSKKRGDSANNVQHPRVVTTPIKYFQCEKAPHFHKPNSQPSKCRNYNLGKESFQGFPLPYSHLIVPLFQRKQRRTYPPTAVVTYSYFLL